MYRDAIVREAQSWVGVKWKHKGRNRKGIECVGLIVNVIHAVTGVVVEVPPYDQRPSTEAAFRGVKEYADRILEKDAKPGDLVQLRYGDHAAHFGFLTERGVIHAHARHRKVIEQRLRHTGTHGTPVAYYRIKGIL